MYFFFMATTKRGQLVDGLAKSATKCVNIEHVISYILEFFMYELGKRQGEYSKQNASHRAPWYNKHST